MKKKNIAWGLFFIFLAAVYLVISSTGMEPVSYTHLDRYISLQHDFREKHVAD